jgi:hypothetical protein
VSAEMRGLNPEVHWDHHFLGWGNAHPLVDLCLKWLLSPENVRCWIWRCSGIIIF